MKKRRYMFSLVLGMTVCMLTGCSLHGNAGADNSSATQANQAWGSGKAVEVGTEATEGNPDSYSVTSVINGSVLQADIGKSSYVVSEEHYVSVKESSSVFLPDLDAWSGGALKASSITETDGMKTEYFFTDISSDLELADEYLAMLSADYGVTYSEPSQIGDYFTSYVEWNLTFPEGTGKLAKYDSLSSQFVSFEYPAEIGLIDTGTRQSGENVTVEDKSIESNTVLASYERNQNGYDDFTVMGWDSSESIRIRLYPGEYEKGDVFTLEDFKSQANAGNSATMNCYIASERIFETAFEMAPYDSYADRYSEVKVEILDKTDSVTCIYYYFLMNDMFGDLYEYEGIIAAETGNSSAEVTTGDNSDGDVSIPAYTGSEKCSNCQGRGDEIGNCVRCNGTGSIDCTYCTAGLVDCTKCGGRGTTYDMVSNSETECYNCHYSGKVDCWKCNGTGGLTCTNCNGRGHAECNFCHGTGKK